ncbi:NmrA family protein [Paenibacillus sp. FSL P4-0081]|uniref:SDR family oxidoreductase n=1 Tax=unclassified Paenibacillus TaxID=185978 RepID=UPI0004F5F05D|nr:SDR family oxidoreductase [Paenibacillus sp. FSL P4-0081]AIQ31601.1 NmrA family protein [Paenibacillus sp. FSL P4-0081]
MTILVTGATGQLGSKIMNQLLKSIPASELAVSVRNPEKAEQLRAQGVDVRYGDFAKPETLDDAFTGVDRLLIISSGGPDDIQISQHTNAVEAAVRAKVAFIAYTSVTNAQESQLSLIPAHRVTEQIIKASGIPYSFLRNNWYLENEISSIKATMAGAPWITSSGTGRGGWATREDYAIAIAAVLTGSGHENTVYELSGPPQDELAASVGVAIGEKVIVQHVDDETYIEIMKGVGVPEYAIPVLVGIQQGNREGYMDFTSGDFEKLLGRPLTSTVEGVRQIISSLS